MKVSECEDTTTVPPVLRLQSVRPLASARMAGGSRWLDGSSRKSTAAGCRTNAASETRAFSPPLRTLMGRMAESPLIPRAPRAARAAVAPVESGEVSRTYCKAVASSGSVCARSCVKNLSTRSSGSSWRPATSGSCPARVRKSVVLPAPLGPRSATRLPRVSLRCTSARIAAPASMLYPTLAPSISICTSGDRTGLGSCKDILRAPTSVSASSCVSSLELAVPSTASAFLRAPSSASRPPEAWHSSSRFAISFCIAFLRDWAAAAFVAFAPKRSMKALASAMSRSSASSSASCCLSRSVRMRWKVAQPPA
mmetsp:Transcript_2254/g.8056  ORF Transcript_2254/g.8056 Transcript_2254/m.8056 type:complete len:310 (+) Transcript_2254:1820-2749(+)